MNLHMRIKRITLGETHPTNTTRVGLFPCMNPHMYFQRG